MFRAMKHCFLWKIIFISICPIVVSAQSRNAFGSLQPDIKFEHFTKDDWLGHNRVTSILQDQQGFLWVATLGSVWRYDGYNFRFARYGQNDSSGLSYPEIQSLCEDSQDNLWVGIQRGGIDLFDSESGKAIHYTHDPADPNSLSDGVVYTIHEEQGKPGVLWIGTTTGLCRMERDGRGNPQFLLSNYVWDIVIKWNHSAQNTIGRQFVDAIDSISANIAEGFGRYHKKDKVKFYRYSFGSVKESFDWNEKSKVRNLLKPEEHENIYQQLSLLPKEINGLIKLTNHKLTIKPCRIPGTRVPAI